MAISDLQGKFNWVQSILLTAGSENLGSKGAALLNSPIVISD
jgi:hypothetical protein